MDDRGARDLVLAGRFRLDEALATDPLVEVWRGTDLELQRDIVCKLLRRRWADDPTMVERFRFEALAAAKLVHDHVARTFAVESSDGVLFTVSEYVDGPTVGTLASRGPLSPQAVAGLGHQAALGLAAAHAHRLVHRAVCPANLVVSEAGRACVIDFGSVRELDLDDRLPDPIFPEPGVTRYWAPEQHARASTDDRVDVYSLGLVLWEVLTGDAEPGADPADDSTARRLRSRLGTDHDALLRAILTDATAQQPDDRPDAATLAEELAEICGTRPQEHLEPLVRELAD